MSSPRWRSAHRSEQRIKTLLLRTLEAEASAVSLPGRAVHVRGGAADDAQRADLVEKLASVAATTLRGPGSSWSTSSRSRCRSPEKYTRSGGVFGED